ncbi:MAG: cold-shock protein [Lysobacteraceae bacterium]|nr:MAG: cold-shock protein [Xanthomonadaceae bacterium]
MRTHGTLVKWNEERGSGFISPAQAGEELFVHVSAFPRDGERPRTGELISFETEVAPNGKSRAIRVMRPGRQRLPQRSRRTGSEGRSSRRAGAVLAVVATVAIAAYGYSSFLGPALEARSVRATAAPRTAAPTPSTTFECDGRRTCSQMRSCDEARYFHRHCPNTSMDGNNDGEPCERQWCN